MITYRLFVTYLLQKRRWCPTRVLGICNITQINKNHVLKHNLCENCIALLTLSPTDEDESKFGTNIALNIVRTTNKFRVYSLQL